MTVFGDEKRLEDLNHSTVFKAEFWQEVLKIDLTKLLLTEGIVSEYSLAPFLLMRVSVVANTL